MAGARSVDDPSILRGADAARERLGLKVAPRLLASAGVACPIIWCWGRRPILIVPRTNRNAVDWPAVLTHELAHWKRRDHLAQVIGEVATCLSVKVDAESHTAEQTDGNNDSCCHALCPP